jgi:hypoxanthine-DNA glycosylase
MMVKSLHPIIDEHSHVLILGTMPGEESLRRNEYYAHPGNQFWALIYGIFDRQPDPTYVQRTAFLQQTGIALWDVLGEANREGSLDSAITDYKPNNFTDLFTKYPDIRCIALNGSKAAKLFKRHVNNLLPRTVTLITLPSTSPTPGLYVKAYKEKLEDWSILAKYLKVNTA